MTARRRRFTAEYKAAVPREYDAIARGQRGALLRREGLYASHISNWEAEREREGLMVAVVAAATDLGGVRAACEALGASRASHFWRSQSQFGGELTLSGGERSRGSPPSVSSDQRGGPPAISDSL